MISMERGVLGHRVLFARVGLDSLLCPVAEDDVTNSVTLQDLVHDIAGIVEKQGV